jgi:hypothetical protein
MMVNRFAHLEDYASPTVGDIPSESAKKGPYIPKSAFQKKEGGRPENPAFQMNRKEGREPRLGPMSENAAFQSHMGPRTGNVGTKQENPAFQMNRYERGSRNDMGENSAFQASSRTGPKQENPAFQMNRRGNSMGDNPAFAAKKRRDDYDPYNFALHPSLQEPPKPKEITEEDIKSEEFFPTLGSSTPSATGTKTPSATTTASNTPKATWGAPVKPLAGSSSFKDLVKKAAEKTEQEKKEAEDAKRLQEEKDKQRKHTRIIALNIRAPGLKPQMSYDDVSGGYADDPSLRTPYYSRIEEDDDNIGLDEDD